MRRLAETLVPTVLLLVALADPADAQRGREEEKIERRELTASEIAIDDLDVPPPPPPLEASEKHRYLERLVARRDVETGRPEMARLGDLVSQIGAAQAESLLEPDVRITPRSPYVEAPHTAYVMRARNMTWLAASSKDHPEGFIRMGGGADLWVSFHPASSGEMYLIDFVVASGATTFIVKPSSNENCQLNFTHQVTFSVPNGRHHLMAVAHVGGERCPLILRTVGGSTWTFYAWEATRLE